MTLVDKNLIDKVLENIKSGDYGISTGLTELDSALGGGFRDGYLYILGGRPAMGKTSLALNILIDALNKGIKVTYFSLEMCKEKIIERLLYMMAHVSFRRVVCGNISDDDWDRLIEAAAKITDSGLIVDDTPGISVDEISRKKASEPFYKDSQLIIIDYVQLLNAHICKEDNDFNSRGQELDYIARELNNLSRNENIPVLALSQLSRTCERRDDHHPILSDLKGSSSIEEMADVVMFLYRDEYYHVDTELKGIAEILVAKNKYGRRCYTEAVFISEYMKFVNKMKT